MPTGSFKARGAAVGVSRAKELGATRLAMPTNGNAGAAWSTYAARAGLRATIAMPLDAPSITRAETVVTGGDLRLVDGLISDAGRLIGAAVRASADDWFEVATLKEPYRIEGKKTMGLEIAEQLGWRMPDAILYPTGGGVGLIGIHKALTEARELGWLGATCRAWSRVQATGCAPIVTAYEAGADGVGDGGGLLDRRLRDQRSQGARRLPRCSARSARPGGTAVAVDDADLLADLALTARLEGMFLCPEGAATVTAARQLARSGWPRRRRRGRAAQHRRRRDLPRHRHRRRPDDRQGRRAGPLTDADRCRIVLVPGGAGASVTDVAGSRRVGWPVRRPWPCSPAASARRRNRRSSRANRPSPGIGDPYFPMDGNAGIDVERYRIRDAYDFDSGRLSGGRR